MGYPGMKMTEIIEGLFGGFQIFQFGILLGRKIWQIFLGTLI